MGHPAVDDRPPTLAEMAAAATSMLLKLVNGEQPRQSRIELATDLVVRESTAPPPPA